MARYGPIADRYYQTQVWHRGHSDWVWRARDKWSGVFATGTATSRAKARAAALEAVEIDKKASSARWVAVG